MGSATLVAVDLEGRAPDAAGSSVELMDPLQEIAAASSAARTSDFIKEPPSTNPRLRWSDPKFSAQDNRCDRLAGICLIIERFAKSIPSLNVCGIHNWQQKLL